MNTRIFIFLCLFFICSVTSFFVKECEGIEKAVIRAARHADFIRTVFTLKEELVQKADIKQEGGIVKVEFPSNVDFTISGKSINDASEIVLLEGVIFHVKKNGGVLTFQNLNRIRVSRLSAPSRLVIDAYTGRAQSDIHMPDIVPITVVIDPGHGGYDYGIKGKNFVEKDFVMAFVKELSSAIEKKGSKVFLTRKSDYVVPLKERIKIIKQKEPDIVISLHASSKKEFVVYASDNLNTEAVNAITQGLKNDLAINTRQESLPLAILNTNVPAFLIELPNPDEFTYDGSSRNRLLKALVSYLSAVR